LCVIVIDVGPEFTVIQKVLEYRSAAFESQILSTTALKQVDVIRLEYEYSDVVLAIVVIVTQLSIDDSQRTTGPVCPCKVKTPSAPKQTGSAPDIVPPERLAEFTA
jgi:hypothetical protein